MCDFAPRENYSFADAIRDANIKLAGLFTPTPCIVGESLMLITDPPRCTGGPSSTPAQSFPDDKTPSAGAAAAARKIMEGGR